MTKIFSLLFLCIIFISCRHECNNKNLVFENYAPESTEYKTEVVKQINLIGADNLSYYYDSYTKKAKQEYIAVNIEGDSICAKGILLVKDWSKLGDLRREISGYEGVELKGLRLNLEKDSISSNLIFKDLDNIID